MQTIAVFFGGKSNEHEISVITGMLAVNLLRGTDYEVVPVYLAREGGMYTSEKMRGVEDFRSPQLKKFRSVTLDGKALVRAEGRKRKIARIDCALNCCHGGMGEDGTLSALLRWNGVPSASPDCPVSALFMNKEFSQIAARGLNIPVAPSFAVHEEEWKRDEGEVFRLAFEAGYPLIVKPSRLGSSIGVKVAENEAQFRLALEGAFALDDGVLVERYFADKRDVNCAAYRRYGKTVLSPCEEVFSDEDILTFGEKYEEKGERRSELPADLPEGVSEKICEYTRLLYESFRCTGVVRADFLLSGDKIYFNELNTVPGSLACYLFGETLTGARDFLLSLVAEGLNGARAEKETVRTGILENGVFGGKSRKSVR